MRLLDATLAETVRAVHDETLSSRVLVEASLARIDERDDDVRAWARVQREVSLAEADRVDRLDAQARRTLPLAGVPIGVKDIIATAGLETSAGSRILRGWVPPADAPAVRRLREAGAIVLGKTATTEFASADPAPTRNPVDLARTPGGSSAGSAAAVADGMCFAALGTQTAGSILRPATYCGVAGLKPSYDAISREGVLPLAWSLDHIGPIARTVEDLTIVFGAMGGTAETPRTTPAVVGVPDRYFDEVTDEVADGYARALEAIRQLGWRVETVPLPDAFELGLHAAEIVMLVEIAAAHEDWFAKRADEYGPKLRSIIETGRRITAASYVRAQRLRRLATVDAKRLFHDIDILVTPATPAPAPAGFATTGDPRFNFPFSALGLPAVSLPVPSSRSALPVGIQLVADHHGDAMLLAAGRQLERQLPEADA
jgi:aspartyl-tRNA(Asn)/glutamyl-tRNA(Gln) amidotransferase subunit A